MATKGSAFGRVMTYFRTAQYDEARAAIGAAVEIMEQRDLAEGKGRGKQVRRKKGPRAVESQGQGQQGQVAS